MIAVVVDTTTTFVDVTFRSTRWMKLLTLCHDSKIQLVIPDVVLRETARHWQREAATAIAVANGKIQGIKKSRDRLTDLGIDGSGLVDSAPITSSPDATQHEQTTRDMLLSLGVDVRAVPNALTLEDVLSRDLARGKPFAQSGKGFRDTLVWETLREVVRGLDAHDHLFFVTDNTDDYCDGTGSLASELVDELDDFEGGITRVSNLDQLLAHSEMTPLMAGLAKTDEELATFLALATAPDDTKPGPVSVGEVVKNAVINALSELHGDEVETLNDSTSGHDFTDLAIPPQIEGVTIDEIIGDEATITWQTYETYDNTTFLIQAEIDTEISFTGFAYKSDAIDLEELGGYVLDWDWNDHMAYVSASANARLTFQVQVDQGMDTAGHCELESAASLGVQDDDPHS